jgi:DoxX-like family
MTTTAAPSTARPTATSTIASRVGWGLTVAVTAFMAFDAVIHLARIQAVVDASITLGIPAELNVLFGILELCCLALYVVRPTAFLGAVLLTGYFGGALFAQLRIEAPLVSTALFPVYMGLAAWAGLWLRDPQVRAIMPRRRD